jgi:hypothetical protein
MKRAGDLLYTDPFAFAASVPFTLVKTFSNGEAR